ncbi:hypothetical protein GF325_18300 [Candidatus Bathyarchaeota archaeon]|nr:hypothetical protein [Candidatus Bathyarchaeota archaeon]
MKSQKRIINWHDKRRSWEFLILCTSLMVSIAAIMNAGIPVSSRSFTNTHNLSLTTGIDGNTLETSAVPTPVYKDTNGVASGIFLEDDVAYVAVGYSGVAIINISDPMAPGDPIYVDTNGSAWDVMKKGDFLFIADGVTGLAIINVSDPLNPTGHQEIYLGATQAYGLDIYQDHAFIAIWDDGLATVNISDPMNPGTPNFEDTDGFANNVDVSEGFAYVATRSHHLAIVNVSDPDDPKPPSYKSTDGDAIGVHVDGEFAYVADSYDGLAIVNISDPEDELSAHFQEDTNGTAYSVDLHNDHAIIAELTGSQLALIDVINPQDPGTPEYIPLADEAYDIQMKDGYAFIALNESGLAVVDIESFDQDAPAIISSPTNMTVDEGAINILLEWNATDMHPSTFSLQNGSTSLSLGNWTSGSIVSYNITVPLVAGDQVLTMTFHDRWGNSVSKDLSINVQGHEPSKIPGFFTTLLVLGMVGTIVVLIAKKPPSRRLDS